MKNNENGINLGINELLELDLETYKKQFEVSFNSIILKHSAIPKYLYKRIKKVDFRKEATLRDGSKNDKLTLNNLQVICVEKLLEVVENCGLGICNHHGTIYMYNGAWWKRFSGMSFEKFAGKVAELMGVNGLTARHFTFTEPLTKQFSKAALKPDDETDAQELGKVLINLSNGTFEVDGLDMRLREPNKADFLTYQLPFEYDEKAVCPIFMDYLNTVLPDTNLQTILAEYLGYLFIRTTRLKLEKALILYGSGANGKSVMFEIVNAMLGGQANVSNFSLQNLTNEKGYYRAMLGGKLVNYSSEINGQLDEAIFKQLVSGEPVDARLPYGEPFTLINYGKMIFNCNELPRTSDHTNAFFRRFLIIPFEVTIPELRQDKQLAQKIIKNELPGVLNWVLEGLKRLISQKNFTQSEEVNGVLKSYIKDSDSAALFIDEMGYEEAEIDFVPMSNLYADYKNFCILRGNFPLSYKRFANRLRNMGISVRRRNSGLVVYVIKKVEVDNES